MACYAWEIQTAKELTLRRKLLLIFRGHVFILPRPRELREDLVFQSLLTICPGLEERITNSSEDEIDMISDLVRSVGHYFGKRY
jgi:hypothetical protein